MITLQTLKDMEPEQIFGTGIICNPETFGLDEPIKWVAVRGGIWDWAIYYGDLMSTDDYIARIGNKIHDPEIIRSLVECDDEAFSMYRH